MIGIALLVAGVLGLAYSTTMTRERPTEIVRRAYLSVLHREPDAASRGYVDHVLRDKWTEEDVVGELRKSPEFRGHGRGR
jgi:hypothetical protein